VIALLLVGGLVAIGFAVARKIQPDDVQPDRHYVLIVEDALHRLDQQRRGELKRRLHSRTPRTRIRAAVDLAEAHAAAAGAIGGVKPPPRLRKVARDVLRELAVVRRDLAATASLARRGAIRRSNRAIQREERHDARLRRAVHELEQKLE
jgi:hypothetical protein